MRVGAKDINRPHVYIEKHSQNNILKKIKPRATYTEDEQRFLKLKKANTNVRRTSNAQEALTRKGRESKTTVELTA